MTEQEQQDLTLEEMALLAEKVNYWGCAYNYGGFYGNVDSVNLQVFVSSPATEALFWRYKPVSRIAISIIPEGPHPSRGHYNPDSISEYKGKEVFEIYKRVNKKYEAQCEQELREKEEKQRETIRSARKIMATWGEEGK